MRAIVELFIRYIHLIAAIVWFGGVVFSTLIATPIVQQNLPMQDLLAIHNRFRRWIQLMIHILLITGAMVFFIVAWNNDMDFEGRYMVYFVLKLAAFGFMALFWGLYNSLHRRYLEEKIADGITAADTPRHINVLGYLTLISGLIVFALALLVRK